MLGVLFAVYLIVSVGPVAAANTQLVVGSQHTTCTDFNNAALLEDVTVEGGSGNGCSVALFGASTRFSDGFEDEPADQGPPEDWENTSLPADDALNVTTQRAFKGSQSVYLADKTGTGDAIIGELRPATQPYTTDITTPVSAAIYIVDDGGTNDGQLRLYSAGTRVITVGLHNGDLAYFDGSWTTIATAPDTGEWIDITIKNINNATHTYDVSWSAGSDSGTATDLAWETTGDGYDETRLWIKDAKAFFDDFRISGLTEDRGVYLSQNHTVETASQANVNLSVTNATATVTVEYNNSGAGWTSAASATYTTDGNKTLDISGHADQTKWRVNVTFVNQSGNGAPSASLYDESILFVDHAPIVDNSSASPQGGTKLQSQGPTLSIPVTDPEFGTPQGETLTADVYLDGTRVDTQTLNSNGTVSYTASGLDGGTHHWHVDVTDSYGLTTTSQTFTFDVPAALFVRNVTNTSQLVNNTTVTITFFSSDRIIKRSTDTGRVNMTGVPAGEKFIVRAQADGYFSRRIIIDSLYQQESIYLLPTSTTGVEVSFQPDDATGQFTGPDTELLVQRALNVSGNTTWETVIGDQIGANGEVPTILQRDQRYRLIIRNTETARILGSYTPTSPADPEILPIGEIQIQGDSQAGTAFGASLTEVDANDNGVPERYLRFAYADGQAATTQLTYRIVRADNTSHIVLSNTTIESPSPRVIVTENLTRLDPSAPAGQAYTVTVWAVRDGQPNVVRSATVGAVPSIAGDWGVDPDVLNLMGIVSVVAFAGWTVIQDSQLAALGTVVWSFMLTFVGVVQFNPALLGLAGAVAVLVNVGRTPLR